MLTPPQHAAAPAAHAAKHPAYGCTSTGMGEAVRSTSGHRKQDAMQQSVLKVNGKFYPQFSNGFGEDKARPPCSEGCLLKSQTGLRSTSEQPAHAPLHPVDLPICQ